MAQQFYVKELEENRCRAVILYCHKDAKRYEVITVDYSRVWETAFHGYARRRHFVGRGGSRGFLEEAIRLTGAADFWSELMRSTAVGFSLISGGAFFRFNWEEEEFPVLHLLLDGLLQNDHSFPNQSLSILWSTHSSEILFVECRSLNGCLNIILNLCFARHAA